MEVLTFAAYCLAIYLAFRLVRWLVGNIKIGKIKERSIFISGCDTGFGHDAAIRFSQMGFQVFAGCYEQKSLAFFDSYSPKGGNIISFQLNVTSKQSIEAAGIFIRSKLPKGRGLWAIINNAGVNSSSGPTAFLKRKHYEDCLAVNLYGVIDVTRELLPLVQMERGRVVNMASLAGRVSGTGLAPYNISKYGVEAFSDCLRREMYHFGVSVHIIEPGFFKSNMTNIATLRKSIRDTYDQAPIDAKRMYGDDYISQAIRSGERRMDLFCLSNTELVIDAYVHATTSIAPYLRYPVGWFAHLVVMLLILPTQVLDLFLAKSSVKPTGVTP